jgi:hypothetical protein
MLRDSHACEVWQGVDVSVNARLGVRTFLRGGLSTGSSAFKNCGAVENNYPGQFVNGPITTPIQYCAHDTPFLTQYNAVAGHTFPLDIQTSIAVQSIPGAML